MPELHQQHAAAQLPVRLRGKENLLHLRRDVPQLPRQFRMRVHAHQVHVPVKAHDPLQVEERIHERVGKLDHQQVLPVRVDDRVHLHRPDQQEVPFHRLIGLPVDHEDVRLPGAHQQDLAVGMPVLLVAPPLVSGEQVEGAHALKPVILILAVVHARLRQSHFA